MRSEKVDLLGADIVVPSLLLWGAQTSFPALGHCHLVTRPRAQQTLTVCARNAKYNERSRPQDVVTAVAGMGGRMEFRFHETLINVGEGGFPV